MVDVPGAQLLAHDPGQRTAGGLGDIRNGQQLRLQFVAGAQRRKDGDAALTGLLDQIQLAADQIDGVHDVIVPGGKEVLPVGGVVDADDGMHCRLRTNVPAAGGSGLRFRQPHSGMEGVQLAVDIAEGDGIAVDQRQLTDTGAAQCLGSIAAHTAQTEHRHVTAAQLVHGRIAQNHFRS